MPWADPGSLRAVLVQRPLGRRPGLGLSPGGLAGAVGEAAICRFCASLSSLAGLSATMSPLLSPDLTSVIASLLTPSATTRHSKPPSGCCTATWSLPSNRTTDAFGSVSTLSSSRILISTRAVIPGRRAGLLSPDAPTLMDVTREANSTCVDFDPYRTATLNG